MFDKVLNTPLAWLNISVLVEKLLGLIIIFGGLYWKRLFNQL